MNPKLQERLDREAQRISTEKTKAEGALKLFPFELKSVEEIKTKVDQSKINFYDITFGP